MTTVRRPNPLLHRTQEQTRMLDQRLQQNRGISASKEDANGQRTFSIGGQGSLMQAFFDGQLDKGGSRKPNDPASSYSTSVLKDQAGALDNAIKNEKLDDRTKDILNFQLQLNQAMQSSDSDGDGKVSVKEWQSYITDHKDSNGKLNFVV